jgi:hypothetical protein
METKNNTEKVSIESGWKLLADICHKADKNELLRRALKKVANMNKKDLMVFLGEKQKQFGRLLRIVSDISLEANSSTIVNLSTTFSFDYVNDGFTY